MVKCIQCKWIKRNHRVLFTLWTKLHLSKAAADLAVTVRQQYCHRGRCHCHCWLLSLLHHRSGDEAAQRPLIRLLSTDWGAQGPRGRLDITTDFLFTTPKSIHGCIAIDISGPSVAIWMGGLSIFRPSFRMRMRGQEPPDVMPPTLRPPNSPDLSPSDGAYWNTHPHSWRRSPHDASGWRVADVWSENHQLGHQIVAFSSSDMRSDNKKDTLNINCGLNLLDRLLATVLCWKVCILSVAF